MTPPPGLPRANDSVPPIVTAIKDSQVATGSGVVNYISSFADRYLLGLALFAVILWVFQAYIFRRFSCRTTTDVQEKRDNLEVVFSRIPHDLSGTPDARQLKGRQLELNERASNIIINSIRLRKTWWRHCELFLGFLPTLLYAVVTWGEEAGALELDVLYFLESNGCYWSVKGSEGSGEGDNQGSNQGGGEGGGGGIEPGETGPANH